MPARPRTRGELIARAVVGFAGFVVWVIGIVALGDGREVAGGIQVVLGGVMMSLALWRSVPPFLRALWHTLSPFS